MASPTETFNKVPVLNYLGLPDDYSPSPDTAPIAFLHLHLSQLPPNILQLFSYITTHKERTSLVPVRNRRLRYVSRCPLELCFVNARNTWPELWQGHHERRGVEEGNEEREWAKANFLEGAQQHVGKLGNLLGDYEEEREAERVQIQNLRFAGINLSNHEFVPEEDDDDDDDDGESTYAHEPQTNEEAKGLFERRIREQFIYGLLDNANYDNVDWDESLDEDDEKEAEDRWFDSEECS